MKKIFLFALVATLFAACSTDATQDVAPEIPTSPDELYVSFDEETSRIQLGENGSPVWTEGDLVSVFYRSNANQKWQFQGKTGDATGTLKRVSVGTPTTTTTRVVAVYPFNENYYLNPEFFEVQAFLPAEQTYAADSFGIGSSIMISAGTYNQLSFKNVCGWLKLQFTGTSSQKVERIVLRGNNGEQVAGEIYINSADASCVLASEMGSTEDDGVGGTGGNLVFDDAILTEVTLNCGDGIALNSETPTAFYIALPPQTFEKGITVEVLCTDESVMTKSTSKSLTIERNHIVPMAEFAIHPNNEIWYTSTDGNIVEPNKTDAFGGVTIVSNTYENGKGIIKFNGDITWIHNDAFRNCSTLASVIIPNSVTYIVQDSFRSCPALTKVTIGNSVTKIGVYAFYNCSALTSINIPDSVTEIGWEAFNGCIALKRVDITNLEAWCKINFGDANANPLSADGGNIYLNGELLENVVVPKTVTKLNYTFIGAKCIKSITIPNSVTSIGERSFYGCSSLTRIDIPDSVTVIEFDAFSECSALTSVTIGNSVTLIGGYAFYNCSALTSINIPDSVTSIGGAAFAHCYALESVTIPNSVTSIGNYAFHYCLALKEVYCKPTTPPTADLGGYQSWDALYGNASGRKIYVPTESVDAYKTAEYWSDYASDIEPYNFTE